MFNNIISQLKGFVFYRIDENGNHLIKPLKRVEHLIIPYSLP